MNLPSTPRGKKIERIVRDRAYHNHNNAGKLAVKLACQVFFTERVMAASFITGDRGRLEVLDADKLDEIEDIVVRMYRGKVRDIPGLWETCKRAISKKCQNLRKKYQN